MHCDFTYEEEERQYVLKDHASQNGTFLNGQRLSEVSQQNSMYMLVALIFDCMNVQ